MLRVLLVLGLAASAYDYGRIVGGEDADITNYNHQISLRMHGRHRCGGSLIDTKVVVTAGHCIHGFTNYPKYFTVVAGSSNLKEDGMTRGISKIHINENFNPNNLDYDVAIIILESPFRLSDSIGIVELVPKHHKIPVGTLSAVTGWGAIQEGGDAHDQLQVVKVTHIDWDDCKEKYRNFEITTRMSCWGYTEGKKDACQYDSGGPLVIYKRDGTPQLAGIVSWGDGCALPNNPGVYADITNQEVYDYIIQFL